VSGLSPRHHSELNHPNVTRKRLKELRRQYRCDAEALEQIDIYDGDSGYGVKIHEIRAAYKAKDELRIARLEAWFRKHYPRTS